MKPLRTVLTDYLKYKIQRNHREAMRRRNRERRRLAEDDASEEHSLTCHIRKANLIQMMLEWP